MTPSGLVRRGERAQGTVEFALVVPLFLALLLGVVEFSWVLYTHTTLQHAAQQGVRRGMVLSDLPGAFAANGNSNGTYSSPIACNPNTIVGNAACSLGAVALSRTAAWVCQSPSVQNCPPIADPNATVPPGRTVELQLKHTYSPLIVGFFPGLEMTGHAEGATQ